MMICARLIVAIVAIVSGAPIVLNDALHGTSDVINAGVYPECMKDAYLGNYLSGRSRGTGGQVVYKFDPPQDGCYVVEEWHPGNSELCNRYLSSSARVDVGFCKGQSAYGYIDQTRSGGRWNIMGALPFYVGWEGNFTLTNSHKACREGKDCFWVADAFRVTKVSDLNKPCLAPATMPNATYNPVVEHEQEEPEVLKEQMTSSTINKEVPPTIVDDAMVLERKLQGDWQIESKTDSKLQCRRQGWKQQFLFLDPLSEGTKTDVEFIFEPQADGCYLVEEFHPAGVCEKNLAPEVPTTITFCKNQQLKVNIDQTTGGNRWNVVALLPFYLGHKAGVKISPVPGASGIVVADAFRFTKVASTCVGARSNLNKYHEVAQHAISLTVDDQSATIAGSATDSCNKGAMLGSAHAADEGEASAKFSILPPSTGCYRVDQYHPKATVECSLGLSDLRVDYCLGQAKDVKTDMSKHTGNWNVVGHFPFYAGEPGSVTSRRLATFRGMWAADAFRFTKVSDSCRQIPEAVSVTLRLTGDGLHLTDPKFKEGHLTKYADMRLAFHEAMVQATGLGEEAVRLLALRNGSIIIDFELVGAAGKKAATALDTTAGSPLQVGLCSAATVGMEIKPECKLELSMTNNIASVPFQSPTDQGSETTPEPNLVMIVMISGAIVLLFGTFAGILLGRRCARKSKSTPASAASDSVVVLKEAVDQELHDNASTATPDTVEAEVQTEVSGDVVAEQTENFSEAPSVTPVVLTGEQREII